MDAKEELEKIIRTTVPQLSSDKIEVVVNHLMSDDVGVSSPSLITHITEEDILHLGKVPRRALLQAFQSYGTSKRSDEEVQFRQSSAGNLQNPGPSTSFLNQNLGHSGNLNSLLDQQQRASPTNLRNESESNDDSFEFQIDWDDISVTLCRALNKAEVERVPAHPEDKRKLKLAVACQLVRTYRKYCEMNPSVKFKTPGLTVYGKARDQVFAVYNYCLKDFINNEVKADGKDTFLAVLKICVDNKCRPIRKRRPPMTRAVPGRGKVVVLSQQAYEPNMTEDEETEQLEMKQALKDMHKRRKTSWDIPAINRNMHNSYALQRKEIVQVLKKLQEKQTVETDDDPSEPSTSEDDDGVYPYIEELKEEWPYLFEIDWSETHFQLLMGHLLRLPISDYVTNHMDDMMTYLTSSNSASTVKNIAIKRNWEANGNNPSLKVIVRLCMVFNYFKEDYKVFIKTTEKTTRPEEIKYNIDDLTGEPCLVVLDNNMFKATKCLPCIDQVALTSHPVDFDQGLVVLMSSIFILDAEYPEKAPHSMEFLERVIFGLAADKSRLPRKRTSTPALLLNPIVARLVNNAKSFIEDLEKLTQQ